MRTLIALALIVAVGTIGVLDGGRHEAEAADDDAVLVDLAAFGDRTCGLDDDAGVWCWGLDVVPPAGTFVAAGAACGIETDGTASCWNGTEAADGLFTAVDGGDDHSCGIRPVGDIVCWGTGAGAQGAPTIGVFDRIEAGSDFTCAIDTLDAIVCWGANDHLQTSGAPAGAFESVSAGVDHACAIAVGGALTCWGRPDDGRASPPAGAYTDVTAGDRHSCAIRADGTVACWGYNGSGQAVPPAGTFVAIGSGDHHNCGLRTNGEPECWGDSPASIAPIDGYSDISTGDRHACAIVALDGSIECWSSTPLFGTVPPVGVFTSVDVGYSREYCAVRAGGSIVCWGGDFGADRTIPGDFDDVSVGRTFACGLGTDARVTCWRPGDTPVLSPEVYAPPGRFRDVVAEGGLACGLRTDATLACWTSDGPSVGWTPPLGEFTDVDVGCAIRVDRSMTCWGIDSPRPPAGQFAEVVEGSACAFRDDRTIACPDEIAVPTGTFSTASLGDATWCGLRPGGRRACWGALSVLDGPLHIDPTVSSVGGPTAIQPARLADTRTGTARGTVDGEQDGTGRLGAGGTLVVKVAGRGGVPDDATSAVLNVIAVAPAAPGFLTVYACDEPRPKTSNLNYLPGEIVTNAVFSAIDAGGDICVYSLAATDLVVDVNGFTPVHNTPVAIRPARLLDTRSGPGNTTIDGHMEGTGPVETPILFRVPAWGRGNITGGAEAVYINVTVIDPDGPGFISIFDCSKSNTKSSSLNYLGGDVVTNLVLAPVDRNGDLCFFTLRDTDMVVDAFAYVPANGSPTALSYHRRMLDTRSGSRITTFDGKFLGSGPRAAGSTTRIPIAGRLDEFEESAGFMLNVIAVDPAADGFLTVFPCDRPRPLASNVNYRRGSVVSNAVFADVDPGGDVCVYTLARTDIVIDAAGYLLPD